jgi:TRAP-type mannitol/chloroaromatic compound transport system permease small subunit
LILIVSWDYVASSWAINEASREAGGLPWLYLLKTLLLLMPVTIMLQGLSEIIKNILFLLYSKMPASPQGEA